jgi:hypothetical protein
MKAIRLILVIVLGASVLSSCGVAPKVVQGHVVSYSLESNTLVVKDETAPNQEMTFSTLHAEMGALTEPGDLVRVSYREEGEAAVVLRVMNLTKQKELQRTGH